MITRETQILDVLVSLQLGNDLIVDFFSQPLTV